MCNSSTLYCTAVYVIRTVIIALLIFHSGEEHTNNKTKYTNALSRKVIKKVIRLLFNYIEKYIMNWIIELHNCN